MGVLTRVEVGVADRVGVDEALDAGLVVVVGGLGAGGFGGGGDLGAAGGGGGGGFA